MQPAIDHDPNAINGQRRFGNRGCQNHLALAIGCGLDRDILCLGIHRAIKRSDDDIATNRFFKGCLDPCDFPLTGQEGKDRSAFLAKGGFDRGGHFSVNADIAPFIGLGREIPGFDREGAPLGRDHRTIAHKRCNRPAIKGCRHHKDAQIITKRPLGFQRQRQSKVGIKGPFMEFVKQDRANA